MERAFVGALIAAASLTGGCASHAPPCHEDKIPYTASAVRLEPSNGAVLERELIGYDDVIRQEGDRLLVDDPSQAPAKVLFIVDQRMPPVTTTSTGAGSTSRTTARNGVTFVAGPRGTGPPAQRSLVVARNAKGKELWTSRIIAPLEADGLVLTDRFLIVGERDPHRGGQGAAEAFDRTTGSRVWSTRLDQGDVTFLGTMSGAIVVMTRTTEYGCE